MSFTFIDLFAGIGGTRMALESVGGQCLFTSEWDKYARQTYEANFDVNHKIYGDVREIDEKLIPKHDVLVAGFPCQPFSIAGVSKKKSLGRAHGFSDLQQGNLFFSICDVVAEKNPKIIFLFFFKNNIFCVNLIVLYCFS